jgi:hypothetical protein
MIDPRAQRRPIRYEDLFDGEVSDARLDEELSVLPRSAVLLFANMAAIVHNTATDDDVAELQAQLEIACAITNGTPYSAPLLALMRQRQKDVLAHTEQLVVLTFRLMRIAGKRSVGSVPDQGAAALRAMLLFNSLHDDYKKRLWMTSEGREALSFRQRFASGERLQNILVRYAGFLRWARSDEGQNSQYALPVDDVFFDLHSMDADAYFGAGLMLYAGIASVRHVADLKRHSSLIDVTKYLAEIQDTTRLTHWLELNSMREEQFLARQYEDDDTRYAAASLLPLLFYPFVQADEGYVLPSPTFFENAFGPAIYHRLLNGFKSRHDDQRGRFTQFFADYHEYYAHSVLAGSAGAAGARVEREQHYGTKKRPAKSTDVIVFEGDAAVFVEAVGKRPNATESIVKMDPVGIKKDVKAMFLDKLEELNDRIADFRSGRVVFEGIDPTRVRIFPVVLPPEPVEMLYALGNRVRATAANEGWLRDTEPFQILDPEALEALESALRAGEKLSDILDRKYSAGYGDYSMIQYIKWVEPTLDRGPSIRMTEEYQAIARCFLSLARDWGVPGASP